jgi:polysaccharide biosynthesis transport protein
MNAVVIPQEPQFLEHLRDLVRRRGLVLGVFAVALLSTLLIALLTPSVYQSSATILIEQQEIPQDFVRSTITSFADQRIQMISQRVMTSQNLAGIIERNDLYAKDRQRKPREIVIERMRDDVRLKMISADVIDPRSGSPVRATIAFNLSYRNSNSDLAYKVASELTSLYLNENLSARAKQTQQALAFLEDEGKRLQVEIASLEGKIAEFKQKNQSQLPQLTQLNQGGVERTAGEIREVANRISSLEQQELLLRAQLAQISPTAPVFSDTGQRVLTPEDRLKALKAQLAGLKARYGAQHPDVLSTQMQVQALEKLVDADADGNELVRQLDDARTKLAAARARYSAEHPDVRMLATLVDSLEQTMRESPQVPKERGSVAKPDNPVYLQVKAQLDTLQVEKVQLDAERRYLRTRLDDFERRVSQSPEIERQYITLTRDYETAYRKYQDVRAKQLEAQASQNLETERKGERFTLIEPPLPSEAPVSPQRGLIIVLGTLLSALLALGAGVGAGAMDGRVRGPGDLQRLLEVPPLALLPRIVTPEERSRARRRAVWIVAGVAGGMVLALLALHVLWRPLDMLWLQVLRRMGA